MSPMATVINNLSKKMENNKLPKEAFLRLALEIAEDVSSSKEKAVEYLKEEGIGSDKVIAEGVDRIKKLQQELQAKSNKPSLWIKITERLPNEGDYVLYVLNDGARKAGMFEHGTFDKWIWVSHWMPYPELPKE